MQLNGTFSYLYDPFASRIFAVETQSSFNSQALIERLTLLPSSAAFVTDGNRNADDATVALNAEDRKTLLEKQSSLRGTTAESDVVEVVVGALW